MSKKPSDYAKGYDDGYAAAVVHAARIADGHRAMHLNDGQIDRGLACSSVAAFIVNLARERDLWPENLTTPLVLSNDEQRALKEKRAAE